MLHVASLTESDHVANTVLQPGELLVGVERGAADITVWQPVPPQQQLIVANDRDMLWAGANVHVLIFAPATGGW